MKSYQCSRCNKLYDCDEYCMCLAMIDSRPSHRNKGDAEICKKNFESLPQNQVWHEKFSWEK